MSGLGHDQLEPSLRAALRQRAPTLKALTAHDALAAFVQHWQSTPVADLGAAADDGLVVNFDLLQDRGTNFVMTLCRAVAAAPSPESASSWRPGWRLALQLGAKPDLSIFQLPAGTATFDCWDRAAATAFEQQVRNEPAFQALAALPVSVARVQASACQCPAWQMNHPVHGLGWAL